MIWTSSTVTIVKIHVDGKLPCILMIRSRSYHWIQISGNFLPNFIARKPFLGNLQQVLTSSTTRISWCERQFHDTHVSCQETVSMAGLLFDRIRSSQRKYSGSSLPCPSGLRNKEPLVMHRRQCSSFFSDIYCSRPPLYMTNRAKPNHSFKRL